MAVWKTPSKPRYADWDKDVNKDMLANGTLESISERVLKDDINPEPRSGKQEKLENLVNRFV